MFVVFDPATERYLPTRKLVRCIEDWTLVAREAKGYLSSTLRTAKRYIGWCGINNNSLEDIYVDPSGAEVREVEIKFTFLNINHIHRNS